MSARPNQTQTQTLNSPSMILSALFCIFCAIFPNREARAPAFFDTHFIRSLIFV